jgi:hypothetical protein
MTKWKAFAMLLASMAASPALAQTAPPPERNILIWPTPDTLSPEGRAMAEAMARSPMPNPMPPIPLQRQIVDSIQASFGGKLQQRYGVRVEMTTIAGVPVRIVYPKGVTTLGNGPVLLNLHGGGFQVDSGSLT